VRLQRPPDFGDDQIKYCVGDIASNRGFRREMAFGELTLKIALSSDEEKEREKENISTQADLVEPAVVQNATQNAPGRVVKKAYPGYGGYSTILLFSIFGFFNNFLISRFSYNF